MALTQSQWDTLKEGTILRTPNVRVRFIKNTNEHNFTGKVIEILSEDYSGYVGEICTYFDKYPMRTWQMESKVMGGDIQFGEGAVSVKPNYESLHKSNLNTIQSLQEENARLKEIIKLLSNQL